VGGTPAAAAAVYLPVEWAMVLLALMLGAALPVATDTAYAWHAAPAGVIVLALARPAAAAGAPEITARLTDTFIGCAIALAFGRLWPHRPASAVFADPQDLTLGPEQFGTENSAMTTPRPTSGRPNRPSCLSR
jgi:hypothetical protein